MTIIEAISPVEEAYRITVRLRDTTPYGSLANSMLFRIGSQLIDRMIEEQDNGEILNGKI